MARIACTMIFVDAPGIAADRRRGGAADETHGKCRAQRRERHV